jgi:antitoxin CptB
MTAMDDGRLRWQCMRRGMLELDLVFARFLERHFDALDERQRLGLARLLEYEDVELWPLVCGRAECRDASLAGLLELLRAC